MARRQEQRSAALVLFTPGFAGDHEVVSPRRSHERELKMPVLLPSTSLEDDDDLGEWIMVTGRRRRPPTKVSLRCPRSQISFSKNRMLGGIGPAQTELLTKPISRSGQKKKKRAIDLGLTGGGLRTFLGLTWRKTAAAIPDRSSMAMRGGGRGGADRGRGFPNARGGRHFEVGGPNGSAGCRMDRVRTADTAAMVLTSRAVVAVSTLVRGFRTAVGVPIEV